MTKRVFEAMAQKVKFINYKHHGTSWDDGYNVGLQTVVRAFCEVAESENPNFDRAKFLTACGLEG